MEASNNFPAPLLEVKTARGKKFIHISDILYIKGSRKHCFIYFAAPEPLLEANCMLKWFSEHLPESHFYRCHDSYIINFLHYDCINGNNFVLKDNGFIPIATKRKAHCLQMLQHFLVNRKNFPASVA